MGLQQFEQRLERLVEGAFAKAFRGELQPVEIGRRLTREMNLKRTVSVRGFIAPNVFTVDLSTEDRDRFASFGDVLERELADAAREHAHAEGFGFLGPVEVHLSANAELARSTFAIRAEFVEPETPTYGFIVRADGQRLPIGPDPITIGRLEDNTIELADPNASRHHAEVRADPGGAVYLIDLRSTNGTRVNGTNVTHQALQNGDVITVGRTSFRFEVE